MVNYVIEIGVKYLHSVKKLHTNYFTVASKTGAISAPVYTKKEVFEKSLSALLQAKTYIAYTVPT